MSKSKKLISLLLAMIMVFSTFAIGASAAYADYKDDAITGYDSIDKPIFTSEQLASLALDAIDAMLADMDETSIKIPVINVTINYSSIDTALDSLEDIYNGGVWNTVKAIAGSVGEQLTFAALNTDPNGNFAANGCRRSTPGKSDLDVLYSVLAFVNDNADLLATYGYGTLDLGPTLTGLLGDSIAEYLDAPLLIRTLLYDMAYDDEAPDYVEYEDLAVKPTIDQMLQIVIDDLLIDLEDELEESFEYGLTFDFSNLVDIDEGSFYDQFESIIQYAYNEFLVPFGNTKLKELIYDLAEAEYDESQKSYRYEYDGDGNQVFNEDGSPKLVKVGYYMDDSPAFQNIRKAPYIYDANAKSVYEANVEAGTFNELADVINLNYIIPEHNFAEGEEFFGNFNNILKEWLDVMVTAKSPELVWEAGSNDMIITNLVNNAKKLLKVYGERFLGEYITIPDDATIDAFTLETAVVYFGTDALDRYAENILLPDSADTVREILSYALCELMADLVPEENIYAKLQSGELNPEGDAGWKAILAVVARYYANAYTNMNIPAGLDFDATISHAVDWALENYGGILYYTSQIDPSKTAWQKLDDVLFELIPMDFLPSQMRVADGEGSKPLDIESSEDIILDWLLGNILDLRIEHIFDVFGRNSTGPLNGTLSNVLITLVTNILNAIIPGAFPKGLTNFDQIATNQTLGDLISGLLHGLYSVRESLIPGALPLVSMILGLTSEQALEDPSIDYPNQIISDTLTLSGTEFVVRNNSTGVNTAYRTAEQMGTKNYNQDALYQVKIKSITTNVSGVSVSYTADTILNGGEDKTFPVTGKLNAEGLVRFAVTYEILDENEKSLTTEPITTYHFTYVAKNVSDEDADAFSYEEVNNGEYIETLPTVFVSALNNHYIVNSPASFIGSSRGWGAIDDLEIGYGRETTDETYMNLQATTTKTGFTVNGAANNVLVPEADFQPIVTQYGGYLGSIDFFDVNVPMVTVEDKDGNPVEKEDDLANYAGVYDLALTLNVTPTMAGMSSDTAVITRKLYVYNDYNLYSIVSNAVGTNRQEANFADSGTFEYTYTDINGEEKTGTVNAATAWSDYLTALTEAQAIVLLPKTMANFDATKYGPAAEKLTKAIAALDACAEGAGVGSLQALLEKYQPSNPEGMMYYEDGYNFFADADYVLYTYERYATHRSNMTSLIDSQIFDAPGEDATEEEIAEYEEKLANKPVLTLFEITYRGHMYEMNAERLVKKEVTAASKNYLNNAYNLINGKVRNLNEEDYSKDSWAALQTAMTFAQSVRQDTDYANLKQSKINTARRELIQAYKGLALKGADPADYAQLDAAIAAADAIFAEDNYAEKYAGIEDLVAAYEDAIAVDRELLAEDGQAIVDAAAQALEAALEALVQLEAGIKLFDTADNETYQTLFSQYEGVDGFTPWTVVSGILPDNDGDGESPNYISGLMFDYYDGVETIVGTMGGASYDYYPNDNNLSGVLTTGDYIELNDGTIYYFVLYGDTDGNGACDLNDVINVTDIANWMNEYPMYDNPYYLAADMTPDGFVDLNDVIVLNDVANWIIDPYMYPQDGTYGG